MKRKIKKVLDKINQVFKTNQSPKNQNRQHQITRKHLLNLLALVQVICNLIQSIVSKDKNDGNSIKVSLHESYNNVIQQFVLLVVIIIFNIRIVVKNVKYKMEHQNILFSLFNMIQFPVARFQINEFNVICAIKYLLNIQIIMSMTGSRVLQLVLSSVMYSYLIARYLMIYWEQLKFSWIIFYFMIIVPNIIISNQYIIQLSQKSVRILNQNHTLKNNSISQQKIINSINQGISIVDEYYQIKYTNQMFIEEFVQQIVSDGEYQPDNINFILEKNQLMSIENLKNLEKLQTKELYSLKDIVRNYKMDQRQNDQIYILDRNQTMNQQDEEKLNIHFNIKISSISYNGSQCYIIWIQTVDGMLRDHKIITESKYSQLTMQTISHELMNPLNIIMNSSQQALDTIQKNDNLIYDPNIQDIQTDIEMINNSSIQMQYLVQSQIDIQQIKSNNFKLKLKQVSNLNQKIEQVIEKFKFQAQSNNTQYLVTDHFNQQVNIDILRFQIVMSILLQNAFKFTVEGIVNVVIEDYSTDRFIVYIIDSGKGIAKNELDQIFVMYARIKDHQRNLQTQGIGMGLSTAKSIIEHLKGSIKIRSQLEVGTIVCFTMMKQMEDLSKQLDRKKSLSKKQDYTINCSVHNVQMNKKLDEFYEFYLNQQNQDQFSIKNKQKSSEECNVQIIQNSLYKSIYQQSYESLINNEVEAMIEMAKMRSVNDIRNTKLSFKNIKPSITNLLSSSELKRKRLETKCMIQNSMKNSSIYENDNHISIISIKKVVDENAQNNESDPKQRYIKDFHKSYQNFDSIKIKSNKQVMSELEIEVANVTNMNRSMNVQYINTSREYRDDTIKDNMNDHNIKKECICGQQILVVDDQVFNIMVLNRVLEQRFGIITTTCKNGQQAFEQFRTLHEQQCCNKSY